MAVNPTNTGTSPTTATSTGAANTAPATNKFAGGVNPAGKTMPSKSNAGGAMRGLERAAAMSGRDFSESGRPAGAGGRPTVAGRPVEMRKGGAVPAKGKMPPAFAKTTGKPMAKGAPAKSAPKGKKALPAFMMKNMKKGGK